MNVLLARTTHGRGGVYKVGVGVSLIGRIRWTAAAREGREEREIVSHFPLPSVRIRVAVLTPPHAHARTHARSHSHAPPPPHNPPHSHAVVFCLLLGELPRPPKNAHPRLSGSSGFEYDRSLSQWTSAGRCWITTTRWR